MNLWRTGAANSSKSSEPLRSVSSGQLWRATSQVFQDALSLPECGLALLGRLLCQSFCSISSSQELICSL